MSFHFRNGQLYCEDLEIEGLFSAIPVTQRGINVNGNVIDVEIPSTPAFVYSSATLRNNVGAYLEAIQECNLNCKLGYAMKANGNFSILQTLKASGVQILVTVSGNEVLEGVRAGFAPQNIVLNGNGKQLWELKLALDLGTMINVDSLFDATNLVNAKQKFHPEKEVKVLLRVRPDGSVHKEATLHPYVNTAETSKFGFGMNELDHILEILSQDKKIKVHGIHCHLGSCIYDPDVYKCMGDIMTKMILELEKKGHDIQILDIGGGIGINYHKILPGFEGNSPTSNGKEKVNVLGVKEFMKVIAASVPEKVTLILEPGRSLVANAGMVVCKVLGAKTAGSKKFCVVDASMTEVIRPCLYGAHHQIYPSSLHPEGKWDNYEVVGPICETADFLGHAVPLQEQMSKYLAVMDAGAYCSSMSSTYNMRPRPAEILVTGSSWKYIRGRDSFEDLIKQSMMQ